MCGSGVLIASSETADTTKATTWISTTLAPSRAVTSQPPTPGPTNSPGW
jgi:hypothetical protein